MLKLNITGVQGRKLKKTLLGNANIRNEPFTLDEVVSGLHKHKIFSNRDLIAGVLRNEHGLDLNYYPRFSWLTEKVHILTIREAGYNPTPLKDGQALYKVRHY